MLAWPNVLVVLCRAFGSRRKGQPQKPRDVKNETMMTTPKFITIWIFCTFRRPAQQTKDIFQGYLTSRRPQACCISRAGIAKAKNHSRVLGISHALGNILSKCPPYEYFPEGPCLGPRPGRMRKGQPQNGSNKCENPSERDHYKFIAQS